MRTLALIAAAALLAGCTPKEEVAVVAEPAAGTMSFAAADGVEVHSRLYKATGQANGVVLMFHQAGSNMHEYDPIVPRVTAEGWDCLTVDQRSGGTMWEHTNLTAQAAGGDQPYEDAYPDLVAALTWAEGEGYDRILAWGSSYSASLVFRLAAEHESVTAVLSFSPGEYFDEEGVVAKWASQVKVPCFIGATPEEFFNEVEPIKDARVASPANSLDMAFGLGDGVHGSSTLREDKAPKAYEKYWQWVRRFLDSLLENSVEL